MGMFACSYQSGDVAIMQESGMQIFAGSLTIGGALSGKPANVRGH